MVTAMAIKPERVMAPSINTAKTPARSEISAPSVAKRSGTDMMNNVCVIDITDVFS
jgi:hypothetical protein